MKPWNLHLIRTVSELEAPELYESWTEVFVFGDVAAYRHLVRALRGAHRWRQNCHLPIQVRNTNSMACTIIAPPCRGRRKACVRILERPAWVDACGVMELVIYGNAIGYARLANVFVSAISRWTNSPWEHCHVDANQKAWIATGSCALCVRGPLRRWTREGLAGWDSLVFARQATYKPRSLRIAALTRRRYAELAPVAAPWVAARDMWESPNGTVDRGRMIE